MTLPNLWSLFVKSVPAKSGITIRMCFLPIELNNIQLPMEKEKIEISLSDLGYFSNIIIKQINLT